MQTQLAAGERLIKEGPANHMRGIEAVGGKLYLTNRQLVFEPHPINIQTGITSVPLADVVDAQPAWTRLLNLIPLVPNSIKVEKRSGKADSFVVSDKTAWVSCIKATLIEGSNPPIPNSPVQPSIQHSATSPPAAPPIEFGEEFNSMVRIATLFILGLIAIAFGYKGFGVTGVRSGFTVPAHYIGFALVTTAAIMSVLYLWRKLNDR